MSEAYKLARDYKFKILIYIIYKRLSREKGHVFCFAGIRCNLHHYQLFSSQSLVLDGEQSVKLEEKPDGCTGYECTDYSSSDRSKDSDFDKFHKILILVFRFLILRLE